MSCLALPTCEMLPYSVICAAYMRDSIVQICVKQCPFDGPPVTILTDLAPTFNILINDGLLTRLNIKLEIEHAKNANKIPLP